MARTMDGRCQTRISWQCQENSKQSPSSSAISRIWADREIRLNDKSDDNPKGKRRGWMPSLSCQQSRPPPLPLLHVCQAAALLSRLMAENADDFGSDVEFMLERKIAALGKMIIERLGKWVQGTLDQFLR